MLFDVCCCVGCFDCLECLDVFDCGEVVDVFELCLCLKFGGF